MNVAALLELWEARARKAAPVDAMLINKCIRELREAIAALSTDIERADKELTGWSCDMKDRAFADLSDAIDSIRLQVSPNTEQGNGA